MEKQSNISIVHKHSMNHYCYVILDTILKNLCLSPNNIKQPDNCPSKTNVSLLFNQDHCLDEISDEKILLLINYLYK